MIIKITIGSWRFTWSMAPTTKVVGVNSILPDGNHILMWDFDHIDKDTVLSELQHTQFTFNLPTIYVLKTSPKRGFHAYCFKKVSWRACVEILASTHSIDWNYYKYGIYRQKFTLRISPKCGRKITPLTKLLSDIPEDVSIKELGSWVQYETLADSHKSRKIEVKLFGKEG